MIDVAYIEIDGLLYPNIDTGAEVLKQLGKYGQRRLAYFHGKKPALYRELLLTGKLAEHCEEIEERAFKLSEQMQETYIAKHPLPKEDFWMCVSIRTMAQMVADEVAQFRMIEDRGRLEQGLRRDGVAPDYTSAPSS